MGVLPLSSLPTISPLLPPPSPSRRSRIPTLTPPFPPFLPLLRSIHPISPSIAAPISPTTSTKPRAAARQPPEHVYPDPIPEFATAETHRFRSELLKRLSKNREAFGDDIDAVVQVCAQRFSDFLHEGYGGPGTLLVEPFTDMLLALKEKKLPGAPVAAREALLWAQNYVDGDWEIWTSRPSK